ncbi:AIR synthase related protein, partial [Dialister sp.]|uniref:AIR synthase related protein n=1 Tax=Dialister sp. TaxID=1955814 RepID=UPI002E7FBF37
MKIELRHGAGGEETGRLIGSLFEKYFKNPILDKMEDGAVLPPLKGNPVFTSDSFVVEPLFFPGGNIGRLSICGTVNDLASMGAEPLYLTASFILETGLEMETNKNNKLKSEFRLYGDANMGDGWLANIGIKIKSTTEMPF